MTDKAKNFSQSAKKAAIGAKEVLLQLASFVMGFLMSRTSVLTNCAPFGMAVTAGIPKYLSVSSALGAAVGYFIPITGGGAFRYIAAVLAIAAIRFFMPDSVKVASSPGFGAVVCFIVSAATGLILITGGYGESSKIILTVAESLLASGAAYFINIASKITDRHRHNMTHQELCSAVIFLSIILMSFTSITIAGVSIARVAAIVVILSAARYGHERAGAVAGISIGFVMALADSSMLHLAGGYSLGGMIAGLFAPVGAVGVAVAFIVCNGIVSLVAGVSGQVVISLYEVFAATVLFLIVPKAVGGYLAEFFAPSPELPRLDGLRKTVGLRLSFASNALNDVSKTVDEVAKRLSRIGSPSFENVLTKVENMACRSCGLRVHCWETERAQTIADIIKITKGNHPGEETAKKTDLYERCSRKKDMMDVLCESYGEYKRQLEAEQRVNEVRSILCDQFSGISDMLYEMSVDFEQSERCDTECAENVGMALKNIGIIAADVGCTIDKYDRMTVEVRVDNNDGKKMNKIEIMNVLSSICNRDFEPPCIKSAEHGVLMTLCERPALSVDFGAEQFCSNGSVMCGDAYEYFSDGKGRAIMLLSDGMGTGGRAAVDGAMAAGLMMRLLKAGFGFDCSLKIVNSAMLFKSTDESLATVDISCVDLFTGKTDLYKAGASPTVIRRNGRTGKAECTSLPAGILREVGFDSATLKLSAGDIVVMMSDGAAGCDTDWICQEVNGWQDGTAQQLAERIASSARRRRNDGHDDDVTVMVSIIGKNY